MKNNLNQWLDKARSLPAAQRIGLGAGAAAIVAVPMVLMLLKGEPDYRFVVASEQKGVPEIISQFDAAQIGYEVRGDGSIWVAEGDSGRANMVLAKLGFSSYAGTSYEKLLSNDSLYMSKQKETLLSRQILEENLEMSIGTMDAIESVSVRLALASESGFLKQQAPSSAAVVLNIKPGKRLTSDQVRAIGNLVSAGVRNLPLKNVKILDQKSNLLSNFDEEGGTSSSTRLVTQLEENYATMARQHFYTIYGYDAFTVTSTFDVNFDKVKNTTKTPVDSTVVLSEQSEKKYDGDKTGAGGVPGATSNKPPGQSEFSGSSSSGGNGGAETGKTYENSIINYEVGTSITTTENQVGNIQHVGVVAYIDEAKFVQEDGEADEDFEARKQAAIQEAQEALLNISPNPELTTVQVYLRSFNNPVVEEADVEFWESDRGLDLIELLIKAGAGILTFVIAFFLITSRLLKKKEEPVVDEEVVVEEAEIENELSFDELRDGLIKHVDENPELVSESLSAMLRQANQDSAERSE